MEVADFIAIGVVGGALSVVIDLVKSHFGTEGNKTKLILIALSIAVGSIYFFLRNTIWWQTIIGVLAAASTVYALFLKK